MFSERLLEHFRNPRNVGRLDPPAASAEAGNPVCGDRMCLWLRLEEGRVSEVRYQAKGCAASLAAGSALTELLAGRPVAELRSLVAADIEQALGGLPAASRHAAVLCADVVRAMERELGI